MRPNKKLGNKGFLSKYLFDFTVYIYKHYPISFKEYEGIFNIGFPNYANIFNLANILIAQETLVVIVVGGR